MRPTRLALVGALCALTALAAASPMATAQAPGGTPVAVFEGRGLGSGVGLPLDGANYLASEEDADADEILERFFPGTSGGRREGLVRVEVAGSDHPREGVELTLPTGGTVRDGREVAVAPSFPITVPRGGRVKLWFEDERYRAEVVDGTSVSGTREATTPTTAAAPDATEAIPELASSQHSLWVEPRGEGGVIVSGDRVERRSGDPLPGRFEVVVEAERLFVVDELDVEDYLGSLLLVPDDAPPLEPSALEAAVIAARSYALRAAAAELEVGRFHVHGDERAFPFVGAAGATDGVAAAAEATAGRVRLFEGRPAATLVTAMGGGKTADAEEVFGPDRVERPYLPAAEYETGLESPWRVDMGLADVAERLGYEGAATSLTIGRRGPSGRPVQLVLDGSDGRTEYGPEEFHRALRLPSSLFTVAMEMRPAGVPERVDSPAFQELPGQPIADESVAVATDPQVAEPGGDGRDLPPVYVLAAIGALGASIVVLLLANLQRAMSRRRARRRAGRSAPAEPSAPAVSAPPSGSRVEPAAPPVPEPPPARLVDETGTDDALSDDDRAWLAQMLGREEPPEVDEPEPRRDRERDSRSVRDVLGWHDAPDWLDGDET